MIEPGDCLPIVPLQRGSGASVVLADQRIAGEPFVIAVGGAVAPAALADVTCITVAAAPPDPKASATNLFDPHGACAKALGLSAPALVVVDADLRVAAVLEADAAPAAQDMIRQMRQALETAPPAAPVLTVRDVLEPALCRRLIEHWQVSRKRDGGVASTTADDGDTVRPDIKIRSDVVLEDRALFEAVKMRIAKRAAPMMYRAFHFKLASMEALRIGCYAAAQSGFFARHRDNGTPFTAARRFAMSLNLNTDEYDGGGIVFPEFGRSVYAPPPGAAVIFSCALLHEALPVTRGQRFGVFTFFTDEAGLAQQKALRAKHAKTAQSGVRLS